MTRTDTNEALTLKTESDYDLLYDALRFARDEFRDVNGLRWSNEEYERLQRWLDQIEPLRPCNVE